MSHVTIPATGTGDTTPQVATDQVGGAHFQYMKIVDGTVGGGSPAIVDSAGNLRVAIGSVGIGLEVGASVANFPANQQVTIASASIAQPVSGNVTASVIGLVGASITNTAQVAITGQPIAVAPNGGTLTASVIGLVGASVTNFPATQQVSIATGQEVGASIANFPATQNVDLTAAAITLPVSVASSSVTQAVSIAAGQEVGASVANFPANQQVTIASASITQPISGNVTASVIGYVGASITNGLTLSGAVGASVSNWPYPANIGSATTFLSSAYPGILIGASISNTPAISIASTSVTVGVSTLAANNGSMTTFLASAYPGIEFGASVSNFPATQNVDLTAAAITLPVSVASTNITQAVSVAGGQIGASVSNWQYPTNIGSVAISNTPTVSIASTSISVGVSVANFPVNIGSTTSFPAATAGFGASPYKFISGASFNNVNVKNSAGTVYSLVAMNVNANPRFVHMYDKSTQPSPSSDTAIHTYVVPGNTSGAGAVIPYGVGLKHANGIGFAITGGSMSDSDTTATSLGDVVINLTYS